MLSPFVVLLLALPLLATASLADPQLLRWLFIAAIALVSAGVAVRSDRPAAFRNAKDLGLFLGLALILPGLFVVLAPNDPFQVIKELAGPVAALVLAMIAAKTLGARAASKLAPIQAAAPALLLLADRAIREGLWPGALAIHPTEITSTLGNTALVGEVAMVSLPFLLLSLRRRGPVIAASLIIGLGGPLVWLLIVSDSRGAWLAAVAGLLCWATLQILRPKPETEASKKPDLKIASLAAILVLACLSIAVFSNRLDVAARLTSIVNPEHPTNRVRVELWRDGFAMASDHQLTGVGLGRFGAEHGAYRKAREWAISGADSRVDEPHNEFIRIYAETGLLGLALFLGGFGWLVIKLWKRSRRPGEEGQLAIVACASVVSFAVMSLTWASLQHPAALFPVALIVALALRPRPRHQDQPPQWARYLVFAPLSVALAVLFLQTERETVAVELRDRAEALKRSYAEEPGEIADKARTLLDLGTVGQSLIRVAESKMIGIELRYRLLVTAANLCEQREVALKELATQVEEQEALKPLLNATRSFPQPNAVRELAALQLELAPHHLSTRRLLAGLDRLVGRKPEAITGLERVLSINPDEPHARLRLADYYLEGGTGLYSQAAKLLSEQVSRYPTLQPVADRAFDQLARCQGAMREIDLGLATVETWVAHCGEADHRRAVAGELVLHFGETNASLGRFFTDAETWDRRLERGAFHLGLCAGLPPQAKLQAYLAHLGRYPHDTPIIVALGDTLAADMREVAEMDGLKNRAIALGRCHFAFESLLQGQPARLSTHLRLARGKNPRSGDPYLIELLAQVKARRTEAAIGALRDLIDRGFQPARRLSEEADLADFLALPEALELLERP